MNVKLSSYRLWCKKHEGFARGQPCTRVLLSSVFKNVSDVFIVLPTFSPCAKEHTSNTLHCLELLLEIDVDQIRFCVKNSKSFTTFTVCTNTQKESSPTKMLWYVVTNESLISTSGNNLTYVSFLLAVEWGHFCLKHNSHWVQKYPNSKWT